MQHPDVLIAGAGIVGLSLALELHTQGARVAVLEAGEAMRQTSSAAAGMLAVDDTANPPQLHALAAFSLSLYPEFLDRIAELSGERVPFQTSATLESVLPADPEALPSPRELVPALAHDAPSFRLLSERSVDPRQLAPALVAAVRAANIPLYEWTPLTRLLTGAASVGVETPQGRFEAPVLVDAMGAWSPAPVRPRKGQMLAVRLPKAIELPSVLRTPEVYVVPRTEGPDAGRVVIGATVEDCGFDLEVHALDILTLHARAARLVPALATAEFLEGWSGLRPGTTDGLPILGALARQPRYLLANGAFRNGILLAPAIARVIAEVIAGRLPAIDLTAFRPERF
jgi:glycine oxidase